MKPVVKAIVFRTPKLAATKGFFIDQLGFAIREYSATHFLIHSKGIRLLFVETSRDPEIELYLECGHKAKFTTLEDPNRIKIIIP